MTVFPEDLDSDLEIPRVDKNVSEIGGDVINSIRDSIFAIQRTLGINTQGNKPSLANRLNVSIDSDGLIKRTALSNLGLVTLPISDNQIDNKAAIKESKLDLDHSTASLFSSISSLKIDVNGISSGLLSNTSDFNLHVLGQATLHDGYQININSGTNIGIAGLSSSTIGDALNELSTLLLSGDNNITPHIDLDIPSATKHLASEIGVNASNFANIDSTVTNVQDALDSVDVAQATQGANHVDNFHSNGILKNINSGTDFNPDRKIVGPETGANYTEGTSIITVPGITSFANTTVEPGDILEIASPSNISDIGNFQIRAKGPFPAGDTLGDLPELAANQLAIFHVFTESRAQNDNVVINIYKPASISSESAPLACSVRNSETLVDGISILPPNAARVVSLGFNGSILNSDGYEIAIRAGIGNNNSRDLIITNLNRDRLNSIQSDPVDARSVAERINAFVSDPSLGHHFPITAYNIGDELAIAHNLVGDDFTLEIRDGYSGNFALGLDAYGANVTGSTEVGNSNNIFSVNGLTRSSLNEVFDGYGKVNSQSSTFSLYENSGKIINPLRFGIKGGSVIHITDHPTKDTNGSYTLFSSNSTTISLFNAEQIDAPSSNTTFDVKVTDSNISLNDLANAETSQGIVEVLIDENGSSKVHQRLIYGTSLGSAVEILGLSDNFPVGDVIVSVNFNNTLIDFNIIDDTISGDTVTIHQDFQGEFKLFHSNNIDFLIIRIGTGDIPGGIESVTVNEPLNTDECLKLCTAHFNGSNTITHLIDNRQFGNLSISEIRDDFVEIFSQKPISDLRSNGIVRGFDVLDIPFFETTTNMEALPVQGGVAYVNGARISIETQKVIIPSHDSNGNVLNNTKRIVAINELGTITVVTDELGELLVDGYSSSSAFGKLLPLYEVAINNGGIDTYVDLRLFINNIDEKIELIVDESNNIVGNFRSLEGALLYASKYPGKEKLSIKIINTVKPTTTLNVPDGISIIGGTPFGGEGKHRILNSVGVLDGSSFIKLEGNNVLKNVLIESKTEISAPIIEVNGNNISIEKCSIKYDGTVGSNSSLVAINISNSSQDDVRIVNNKIDNVHTGISSLWGCEDLEIKDNKITNLQGTTSISQGIALSTLTRSVKRSSVWNNWVIVPSVTQPSDLRGITVDVREAIDVLDLDDNKIIHEAEDAMTNGIRITSEVTGGSGNKIKRLLLSDNYITGIRLDDNSVFGIYLDDITDALVYNNSIFNTGVSGTNRSDTYMIFIGSRLDFADINENKLKNGDVLRGIAYNNTNGRANIVGNKIYNIGDKAQCIRGSAPWSNISNNTITGPSEIGIRWTGARTKISDNIMNSITTSNHSFEQYAIYAQSSDIDIVGNTITEMIFDNSVGSIGISNISSSSDRNKIIGNTISGDNISKAIELFGNNHLVSKNKIFNVSVNSTVGSDGIRLNSVTDSVISTNIFDGALSKGINSETTTVSGLNITGNSVVASLSGGTGSLVLDGTTSDCIISGNDFPFPSSGSNTIGSSPSTNVVGVNRGLLDTRTYPAASGSTSYETLSGESEPHWAMKTSGGSYWEVGRSAFSGTRLLYFPISNIPNGARLTSIGVLMRTGTNNTPSAWTIQGFKRDINQVDGSGNSIVTAFTFAMDNTSNPNWDQIQADTDDTINFVNVDNGGTGEETVDNSNFQYFLEISNSETSPTDPDEIRVYGITVKFKY